MEQDGIARIIVDARIEAIPVWEKQEWEHAAMTRAELCNEQFIGHYFDIIMCLRCEHMSIASVLRTLRQIGDLQQTITRRVCCECGYNHMAHRTPVSKRFAKR